MLGPVISLLGSLFWAAVILYCLLVAWSLRTPVPIPEEPRPTPIFNLPLDDDE
jgi:hypothetical protein